MEGQAKKPNGGDDPVAILFAILLLTPEERTSHEIAVSVINTRVFPQLRALDDSVRRAGVRGIHHKGGTVLHAVCDASYSVSLVRYLVEDCGADINARYNDNSSTTVIDMCARSWMDGDNQQECTAVFEYLKSRGAHLDTKHGLGRTELMRLCAYTHRDITVDAIRGLIHFGADVNAKDFAGCTPLDYATRNETYAPIVIDVLLRAGASLVIAKDVNLYIFGHMHLMTLETIQLLLSHSARLSFIHMRSSFVENVFRSEVRPAMWRILSRVRLVIRDSNLNDCTIFHMAAAYNPAMVPVLMGEWCCPLTADEIGRLPRDVVADKRTAAMLDEYAKWTPMRVKTRWYGPYFEERARCFALVCLRWKTTGECVVPRLVMCKIIEWIATLGFVRR